jgi:hypothetical protein
LRSRSPTSTMAGTLAKFAEICNFSVSGKLAGLG